MEQKIRPMQFNPTLFHEALRMEGNFYFNVDIFFNV